MVLHEARLLFMLLLIQKGGRGRMGRDDGGEMNGLLSCVPRGEEEEEEKEKGGAIRGGAGRRGRGAGGGGGQQ